MATKLDWQRVAEAALHPTQVEILNAVAREERLSPVRFCRDGAKLTRVGYHFRALEKAGLLEAAGSTPRRGAVEHFYRLSSDVLD